MPKRGRRLSAGTTEDTVCRRAATNRREALVDGQPREYREIRNARVGDHTCPRESLTGLSIQLTPAPAGVFLHKGVRWAIHGPLTSRA